jgi:subtilisin family serine protease
VVIAVIDSGVMCTHSDLAVNMWVNTKEVPGNGIDDDGNGFVDDINGYDFVGAEIGTFAAPNHPGDSNPCVSAGDTSIGNGLDDDGNGSADDGVTHGTFVAGIAAAAGNNGAGVAGACGTCKIMAVRVANPEGWLRSSDTADAISYATRNGAKVINLSLGGNTASQAEISAIDLAVSSGVIVIAASGNDNKTPISYPARLSNVISVGASAHTNTKGRASFSNWGQGTPPNPSVTVVAPGVDIASTAIRSVADQNAGAGTAGTQGYLRGSGTSFSTPLVSGIVGLMLSVNPALTPAQVRSILTSTAEPLPDDPADTPNAGSTWAGAGMVNAFGAVSAASGGAPTPTPVPGTPTPTPVPGTPTPTPTPLPLGSIPQPVAPPPGTLLSDLGTTVHWNLAVGTTQYQIQVIPANNDGPAINLIRDVDRSYVVVPPVFGTGPYVMLPGMTYTWRIRTTTATTSIDENSGLWGGWSAGSTFRTRSSGSSTVSAVAPSQGVTVASLMPTLQWTNSDPGVFYYEVQLSKDDTFNTNPATATAMVYWVLLHGALTAPANAYAVPASFPLESRTQYFWRVRPRIQGDGTPAAWSSTFRFITP